mmetsp:Transcript_45301/g.80436  ORF Transcript_45301/g.80436 Transcript_45301/m.80436 type:complete len:213 (-) Transcript_45301:2309-2947(-)
MHPSVQNQIHPQPNSGITNSQPVMASSRSCAWHISQEPRRSSPTPQTSACGFGNVSGSASLSEAPTDVLTGSPQMSLAEAPTELDVGVALRNPSANFPLGSMMPPAFRGGCARSGDCARSGVGVPGAVSTSDRASSLGGALVHGLPVLLILLRSPGLRDLLRARLPELCSPSGVLGAGSAARRAAAASFALFFSTALQRLTIFFKAASHHFL